MSAIEIPNEGLHNAHLRRVSQSQDATWIPLEIIIGKKVPLMTSSINLAFLRIAKRADRQDDATLVRTFVDFGAVMAALSAVDHHIIFG